MLPPRAIRALYRFQQQVGLTAAEFRAVCALSLVMAAGIIVDTVRNRAPAIDLSLYAAEDSLFAEAIRRQEAIQPGHDSFSELPALREPVVPDLDPGSMRTIGQLDTIEVRLDLNTASIEALLELPRIGPAIADRILAWRAQFGPFVSVNDLEMIRGIGPATLERLRPLVRVDPFVRDSARVVHPRG